MDKEYDHNIIIALSAFGRQKRQLMGAHSTYIAKPWMNQVYLQLKPWPHPEIAHEIAHIVAASTGTGPFRISGLWGALWPNPALIEGVAVGLPGAIHGR